MKLYLLSSFAAVVLGAMSATGEDVGCTNELGWTDNWGDGCEWYEANEGLECIMYGDIAGDFGMTPKDACCICKEPTRVVEYEDCDNEPGWTDMDGDGCEWYELYEEPGCPINGYFMGASEACCHCGGGCTDEPGWTDFAGDGCDWYELNEEPGCPLNGYFTGASEACCYCAGGGDPSNEVPPPTPTTNADNCTDEPGWTDMDGDGCEWYELYAEPGCPFYGILADANGLEAWHACCHCKVA